jgi:hypothetical protein
MKINLLWLIKIKEKNMKIIKAVLLSYFLLNSMLWAQESKDKFSGYMFGDYFWVAAHHDSTIKNANGFWFRRIYFTYDHSITEMVSVRLRLEMNSAGDFSKTSAALTPYVKDAFLKWKINQNHTLLLGLSEVPSLGVVEPVWGYRFLEKTPLDLQKWISSRDFGVALQGNLVSGGKVKYHLMLGNGSGEKSEVNQGKKIMTAVSFYPVDHIILEAYGDWTDETGATDYYTYQGFAAYKTEQYTLGLQAAQQIRQAPSQADKNFTLASAFLTVKAADKITLVGRVDRLFEAGGSLAAKQSYLPFDPTAKSTLLIAAIDYAPLPDVHLTPNVEIIMYDKNDAGITPDSDVLVRLTFYYQFK